MQTLYIYIYTAYIYNVIYVDLPDDDRLAAVVVGDHLALGQAWAVAMISSMFITTSIAIIIIPTVLSLSLLSLVLLSLSLLLS